MINEIKLKKRIRTERQIIGYFFYPLYILYWLFYEIPWIISSRSRLKMNKLKSIENLETGRIYYTRKTPYNTSGFNVYFDNKYDDENDLNEAGLSDETLSGKNNYHYMSVKKAVEKGYKFDYRYLSIKDEYRKSKNITAADSGENFDITEEEASWIRSNIPEEYQIIFADCGRDYFKPGINGLTSRKYLKMLIEERGCLYKLTDKKMISKLESCGLYDSLSKWEEKNA